VTAPVPGDRNSRACTKLLGAVGLRDATSDRPSTGVLGGRAGRRDCGRWGIFVLAGEASRSARRDQRIRERAAGRREGSATNGEYRLAPRPDVALRCDLLAAAATAPGAVFLEVVMSHLRAVSSKSCGERVSQSNRAPSPVAKLLHGGTAPSRGDGYGGDGVAPPSLVTAAQQWGPSTAGK
jgi:hypothetical protein